MISLLYNHVCDVAPKIIALTHIIRCIDTHRPSCIINNLPFCADIYPKNDTMMGKKEGKREELRPLISLLMSVVVKVGVGSKT